MFAKLYLLENYENKFWWHWFSNHQCLYFENFHLCTRENNHYTHANEDCKYFSRRWHSLLPSSFQPLIPVLISVYTAALDRSFADFGLFAPKVYFCLLGSTKVVWFTKSETKFVSIKVGIQGGSSLLSSVADGKDFWAFVHFRTVYLLHAGIW